MFNNKENKEIKAMTKLGAKYEIIQGDNEPFEDFKKRVIDYIKSQDNSQKKKDIVPNDIFHKSVKDLVQIKKSTMLVVAESTRPKVNCKFKLVKIDKQIGYISENIYNKLKKTMIKPGV